MLADITRLYNALNAIVSGVMGTTWYFDLWDGTAPTTANGATSGGGRHLLVSIPLVSGVSFGSASGTPPEVSLTGGGPPVAGPQAAVTASTGGATWFRITDGGGNVAVQGSIGTSGAELNLNSVTILVGANCSITSFKIKMTGMDQ